MEKVIGKVVVVGKQLWTLEITLEQLKPNIMVLIKHNMKKYKIDKFNFYNLLVVFEYSRTTTSGGGVVILSVTGPRAKLLTLRRIERLIENRLLNGCSAKFKFN